MMEYEIWRERNEIDFGILIWRYEKGWVNRRTSWESN
jgi:hypothetical protein